MVFRSKTTKPLFKIPILDEDLRVSFAAAYRDMYLLRFIMCLHIWSAFYGVPIGPWARGQVKASG